MKPLAQERLAHRQRPPLIVEQASQALYLVGVIADAAKQAGALLGSNSLAEPLLAEIEYLAELASHHAAAELALAEARGEPL